MNHNDRIFANGIRNKLLEYSNTKRELKGIKHEDNLESLLSQIVESKRRIDFVRIIDNQDLSIERTNPDSNMFDPIKAAVIMNKNGNINEACWLTFLAIHFGKHSEYKWNLVKGVYGSLGDGFIWTWDNVITYPNDFMQWLICNHSQLASRGAFGNHRKYESLNPTRKNWNGAIIQSYINWVRLFGDHETLLFRFEHDHPNKKERFRALYQSMDRVLRFGRTAKFDFLTMLEKLNITDIEADSTYMAEATGPRRGANLLFGGTTSDVFSSEQLEEWIAELDLYLNLGMQIIEDSLCNWQKSPNKFVKFRG